MSEYGLIRYLKRQRVWSLATFGPGRNTKSITDHIRKELCEVEAAPLDLEEWVDVIMLALDGAWRAGHEPEAILAGLGDKLTLNESRNWPDWRTHPADKPVEHIRAAP